MPLRALGGPGDAHGCRGGAREAVPELLPAAVCDYLTGYLAAAGAIAALQRRIREGGSWQVQVSLSATAMWLQSLGLKAMLPPPEERQHVKTAIGAARAEQASEKNR